MRNTGRDASELPRGDSRLVLIVQASPNLIKERLEEVLEQAMKRSGCTCDNGLPIVKDVNPSFFGQFYAIYRELDEAPELQPVESGKGVVVAPSHQSARWELRLTQPKKFLKSVQLTYPGGKQETLTPGDQSQRLRRMGVTDSGGDIYEVQPSDQRPTNYTIIAGELGKPDDMLTGEWPKVDNFYLVSFRNFQGDFAQLQKALSDKTQVSDPLKRIEDISDMRFFFANFGATTPLGRGPVGNNRYELRVDPLPGREVARVWVHFPLTAAQMANILPDLRSLKTGKSVSQKIRSGKTVSASTEVNFSADLEPTWMELTAANGGFVRSFPLSDPAQLREKFPKLFYLIVWEFQAAKDEPYAIPSSPRPDLTDVYVADYEEAQWLFSLDKEIKRQQLEHEPAERTSR